MSFVVDHSLHEPEPLGVCFRGHVPRKEVSQSGSLSIAGCRGQGVLVTLCFPAVPAGSFFLSVPQTVLLG